LGVELVAEGLQGAGDAGLVGWGDRDGDPVGLVVDGAGLVEEVAGDGADLVGVLEVGSFRQ
jgi:hypothetical protein